MRALPLIALAALVIAPAAAAETSAAQPQATVEVRIGPELTKKAHETYGVRDVEQLAAELQRDVQREMARTGVMAGGRIELTLVDAKPNRPTFKQLGDRPGLSFESFGLGGARIEGRMVSIDGQITPIKYQWYETDIRQAWPKATWSDANWTIDRFARRLSRGETLASR